MENKKNILKNHSFLIHFKIIHVTCHNINYVLLLRFTSLGKCFGRCSFFVLYYLIKFQNNYKTTLYKKKSLLTRSNDFIRSHIGYQRSLRIKAIVVFFDRRRLQNLKRTPKLCMSAVKYCLTA